MAYTAHPTVVTGQTWTAANQNTYVKDNLAALWVYTTAGDIVYASSSTVLARLAKPASDSLLKNTSAGVPSWQAISGLGALISGVIHAKATVDFNAGDQDINSTTYTDVTNATVNIVTTRTCTIFMIGTGTFAAGSGGERIIVQGVIGGTGSGDTVHTSMTVYVPYTVNYYRTGVGAGTITCKLQGKGNAAGNNGFFHQGRITVLAIAE